MSKKPRPQTVARANNEVKKDHSPYSPHKAKSKLTLELSIRDLPWTPRQKEFIQLALDKKVSILLVKGPAGSAKSILAVYCLLQKMKEKKISSFSYCRVPVESCAHGVGFLKGELVSKMQPYLAPCLSKLEELLPPTQVTSLINDERVVGIPMGFMRGLNVTDGLLLDESQNATVENLLLCMSRMARFSTLIICADERQSDVKNSGFTKVYNAFNTDRAKEFGIYTWEFTKDDICRSPSLAFIIDTFDEINNLKGDWKPKEK
jgi:phosphate starvation-inducible protein PhoH